MIIFEQLVFAFDRTKGKKRHDAVINHDTNSFGVTCGKHKYSLSFINSLSLKKTKNQEILKWPHCIMKWYTSANRSTLAINGALELMFKTAKFQSSIENVVDPSKLSLNSYISLQMARKVLNCSHRSNVCPQRLWCFVFLKNIPVYRHHHSSVSLPNIKI